ncbi:MAG: two-component system, OmpR family, lantibiotic biosynthesis response regulator NisR/SpaR [Clostridiales bacterium]|jgi:DNA-binding response OmpR family regulator|nr:two-component system, OmpR family, lantibiotic biosynthesis response regulator NisR/SpaR [Clostridiales bacterium]
MGYILIADDDSTIANLISDSLEDEGYETKTVGSGTEVIDLVRTESDQIELILLDIMMPGVDGLEVCRQIRQAVACPLVFISAKASSMNRIVGLEVGADDYITKPFSIMEVVARVNAHIRREKRNTTVSKSALINMGQMVISPEKYLVTLEGIKIDLSTREFQILLLLAQNRNRVLSREEILNGVWGNTYADLNLVTVHIKNLRVKLGSHGEMIKTVWGVGYKLIAPEV